MARRYWEPDYFIAHDRGGSMPGEGARLSRFPYNSEVGLDGKVALRPPGPGAAQYLANPYAYGLAASGPVGVQSGRAQLEGLKDQYERLNNRFQGREWKTHGEAFRDTRGTGQQASKNGRGMVEATGWLPKVQSNGSGTPGNAPMPWHNASGMEGVIGDQAQLNDANWGNSSQPPAAPPIEAPAAGAFARAKGDNPFAGNAPLTVASAPPMPPPPSQNLASNSFDTNTPPAPVPANRGAFQTADAEASNPPQTPPLPERLARAPSPQPASPPVGSTLASAAGQSPGGFGATPPAVVAPSGPAPFYGTTVASAAPAPTPLRVTVGGGLSPPASPAAPSTLSSLFGGKGGGFGNIGDAIAGLAGGDSSAADAQAAAKASQEGLSSATQRAAQMGAQSMQTLVDPQTGQLTLDPLDDIRRRRRTQV